MRPGPSPPQQCLHASMCARLGTYESKFERRIRTVGSCREVEHYKFGEQTSMGRRDRRSGQQTGSLTKVDGGVQAEITWGDPYAGGLRQADMRSCDHGGDAVAITPFVGTVNPLDHRCLVGNTLQSPAVMHMLKHVTRSLLLV